MNAVPFRDPDVLGGMALPAAPPHRVELTVFRERVGLSVPPDADFRLSPLSPKEFRAEVARRHPETYARVLRIRETLVRGEHPLLKAADENRIVAPLTPILLGEWLGPPSAVLCDPQVSSDTDTEQDPLGWNSPATRTAAHLLAALALRACSAGDARTLCEDIGDRVRLTPDIFHTPDGFEHAARQEVESAIALRGRAGSALDLLVHRAFSRLTWVPARLGWTTRHARGVALLLLAGTRELMPAEIVPARTHARAEAACGHALTDAATMDWKA